MRILICLPFVLMVGCTQHPAYFVEMNGRRVEFESLIEGSVPRGVEVSRLTPEGLRVVGVQPVEINGVSVYAEGDDLTVASQSLRLSSSARVLVRDDGQVEVQLPLHLVKPATTTQDPSSTSTSPESP